MEYYPRVTRHPTARLASVGSSDSQVESNINDYQESVSMGSHSLYALSRPLAPEVPHLGACIARPALSGQSTPIPQEESINTSSRSMRGSSMDVTHDCQWECVRSDRRLPASANADSDDSECGIEEWPCASHAAMHPLENESESEPESWALNDDNDASPAAHPWDLIPEYSTPRVPRDTLFVRMHGRPLDHRRTRPMLERSHRSARSRTHSPIPHPPIRLPLLSVLVSLLSIDDETLHLVTHSPAHSALFPGPISPSDEGTENAHENHGGCALLAASSQHGVLREGLAVACDGSILSSNPFRLSALVSLLDLVRGFWAGGRAVLRETYIQSLAYTGVVA